MGKGKCVSVWSTGPGSCRCSSPVCLPCLLRGRGHSFLRFFFFFSFPSVTTARSLTTFPSASHRMGQHGPHLGSSFFLCPGNLKSSEAIRAFLSPLSPVSWNWPKVGTNTSSCQTDKRPTAAYRRGTEKQVRFVDHHTLPYKLELLFMERNNSDLQFSLKYMQLNK